MYDLRIVANRQKRQILILKNGFFHEKITCASIASYLSNLKWIYSWYRRLVKRDPAANQLLFSAV